MFHKYNKISNAYDKKTLQKIPNKDDEWVVTEKIHGSNFLISIDKDNIVCGKRTSLLNDDDIKKFCNAQEVFEKYKDLARNIWKEFCEVDTIIIYGELFGGSYPGYKKQTPTTVEIQKNMYYCPHNDFYAFDIKRIKDDGYVEFIDYETCVKLFKKFGFLYAKELFRGNLKECLTWSNEHNADPSTIPKYFNLPPLDNPTIREGHVIKPVINVSLPSGSRVILKDKNEKFSEKIHNKVVLLDDSDALNDALSYINNNRLDNVLSKFREDITQEVVGKYTSLLVRDALEEWEREYDGKPVSKKEMNLIKKRMGSEAYKIVNNRLK